MKTRAWMMVILLASPVLALAQEARSAERPDTAAQTPRKTSFSTANPEVRKILRDAAAASESDEMRLPPASTDTAPRDDAPLRDPGMSLRFRAPRGVHHMDCDSMICTAYDAEDTVLYTVSRDASLTVHSPNANGGYDAWLSCQSTNNLLSTFERYDKCRGIQIAVPTGDGNILLALPRLHIN